MVLKQQPAAAARALYSTSPLLSGIHSRSGYEIEMAPGRGYSYVVLWSAQIDENGDYDPP